MSPKVSVVIPAHNEEPTIGGVVSALKGPSVVDEIIVIDNCSTDDTTAVAAAAGAQVIHVPELGYGRAMKAAVAAARNGLIFKLDGDMRNPTPDWLERHLSCLKSDVGLVKGYWDNSEDAMPVDEKPSGRRSASVLSVDVVPENCRDPIVGKKNLPLPTSLTEDTDRPLFEVDVPYAD